MLSKKMTVSLTSLITILALAFVAPMAMSADFSTKVAQRGLPMYMLDTAGTALDTTAAVTVDLDIEWGQPVGTVTLMLTHFDALGNVVTPGTATAVTDLPVTPASAGDPAYAMRTAKKRRFRISLTPEAAGTAGDATRMGLVTRIIVQVPSVATTDPTVADADDMSEEKFHTITLSQPMDTSGLPRVVSIQRLRPGSQTVVAAFQEEVVTDASFHVRFVLTEAHSEYDGGKTADENAKRLIEVEHGVPSNLVVGTTFAPHPSDAAAGATVVPHPIEGMYEYTAATVGLEGVPQGTSGFVPLPTGSDGMYRQYRVTITPHQRAGTDPFNVKIKVKNFHDGGSPVRNTYVSPGFGNSVHLPNGREILTVKVKPVSVNIKAGYRVTIPKDWHIPGGGYLIIAKSKGGSEVDTTGQDADRTKDAPRATHRRPAQLKYNVYEASTLPNLATQFLNGVVVDVESGNKLYITEVMWGEDVSLNPSSNSQYIELYNPGGGFNTPDDDLNTPDVDERLTLVFYAPNEFGDVPAATTDATTGAMTFPGRIKDRIGTLDAKGAYWSPGDKGSSGRSGTGEAESVAGRTTPTTVPIVSMYRGMVPDTSTGAAADAMMPAGGQMAASWMSSEGPKSANFDPTALGIRHGTPGAATDSTVTPADTAAEEKAAADKAAAAAKAAADKIANTGTIPTAGQIYISEIMFAGGGTLPQWIEIANGSATEDINLSGWTLTVANAAADADVSVGASAKFTIPDGTMIDRSRQTGATKTPSTILVVTEAGRNNIDAVSDQVINLQTDNEVDLILAGVTTRKYTLLSSEAFLITLAPPAAPKSTPPAGETTAAKAKRMAMEKQDAEMRKDATDMAGNLGADGTAAWALPVSDEGRSSIIRAHVNVRIGPSEPEDGTMADNWVLAANTAFADATHIRQKTYYGAMTDEGTPGFRAGSALPVELSHFRPARDKATGQVVITWSTQSELNNAGFFVKRSQQRNGEFKVINATLIAGAGTTSEKQFYTYTDTTAQPNVVYYYQIEDVSLDGNRQLLTRGIRLKGHVSAAGKATTLWGELKTSHE